MLKYFLDTITLCEVEIEKLAIFQRHVYLFLETGTRGI